MWQIFSCKNVNIFYYHKEILRCSFVGGLILYIMGYLIKLHPCWNSHWCGCSIWEKNSCFSNVPAVYEHDASVIHQSGF